MKLSDNQGYLTKYKMRVHRYGSVLIISTLALIMLNACSTVGKLDCQPKAEKVELPGEMQCSKLKDGSRVCAAQDLFGGTYIIAESESWYGMGPGLFITNLNTEPNFSGMHVSPDGRFMAVESTAEGHPLLQFFDIKEIFNGPAEVDSVAGYSGYPGAAWFMAWVEGGAIIESDIDLLLEGKDRPIDVEYPEVYRQYRLLLPSNKLSPLEKSKYIKEDE